MSVVVMSRVFWTPFQNLSSKKKNGTAYKVSAHAAKSVLLAMADSADDFGDNSYNSMETLALKTSLEFRSIPRILRALQQNDYCSFRGLSVYGTSNYSINLEKLAFPPKKRAKTGRPKSSDSERESSDSERESTDSQRESSDSESPDSSLSIPNPSSIPAPNGAKNINPNTGRRTDAKVRGDAVDAALEAARLAQEKQTQTGMDIDVVNRIQEYPPDVQPILEELCRLTGVIPPDCPSNKKREGKYKEWILELRQLMRISMEYKIPDFKTPLRATWKGYSNDGLTFRSPSSLFSNFSDTCRKMKHNGSRSRPEPLPDEGRKLVTPDMVKR